MWFGGIAILGIAVFAVPLMVLIDILMEGNKNERHNL
jgi:hypothetical protein